MNITFKKLILVSILLLFAVSCQTNPPTSINVVPTGNIVLHLNIDNTTSPSVSNKVVLLEDFANVSCVPCVQSNQIIEHLLNDVYGRDKLVAVKFPIYWPSPNDPFYLANKEVCDLRIQYYTIAAAPTIMVDGTTRFLTLNDTAAVKSAINTKLTATPRFDITVTGNLEGDYTFNVTIAPNDTIGININDLVVHCIITETDIEFSSPPGSNGETKFYNVLRLSLPSKEGESLRSLIDNGEISYEFEDALLSSWNLDKINLVVFIQNKNTKEVYQAETIN